MTPEEALRALQADDPRVRRVAELIHAALRDRPVDHLNAAVSELRTAEASEECGWCRSHIASVRILAEDLVRVAEMGGDIDRGEMGGFARRVGKVAEDIGALGVLGRIVHRLKGL